MSLKSVLNDIPIAVRLFLGKALLLYLIWELAHSYYILPSQILDTPLTTHVAIASVWLLNALGHMGQFSAVPYSFPSVYRGKEIYMDAMEIYHNSDIALSIAHACNGLELMVLYVGFIVCLPSPLIRKIKYIVLGVLLIHIVNVLRCAGLIYLGEYFDMYFDFAHHYLFKAVIYATTFLIWMLFSRKINLNSK